MPTNKLDDKVRERVIVAIRRRNYRVTAGDVTAAAGVTLREAEEALQALAHDSLAALEVSDQGDLVYAFPDDFQTRITSRSLLQRLKPALAAAAAGLGYVSRVAFGSCLVASVVVVWVAVAVALSSSSRDDRCAHVPTSFALVRRGRMQEPLRRCCCCCCILTPRASQPLQQ